MCGIVGIISSHQVGWIEQMNDTLSHRGPDDRGVFYDGNVSLAMTRLSIIDIVDGHQPMTTSDGRYTIIFNGEIYNANELRLELEGKGFFFRSNHSDTEVLLMLLVNDGLAALPRLNGMFAFALWDSLKRELLCVRDRFGIKPFYFSSRDRQFAFASELKSLFHIPWISRTIDKRSVFHYMSLMYVPGRNTIISDIYRLGSGAWLLVNATDGTITEGRWWEPNIGSNSYIPRAEACHKIRVAFEEAVISWSQSDVPIGCSLSGGLDSSAIVGLLASKGKQISTYSVGFTGPGEEAWNELPLARLVADRWGTEHHEIVLNPESLLDDLVDMVWHLDEPYGGGLPSWAVFKQMKGRIKVAMTGTGGDELFGNYGKWRRLDSSWLGCLFKLSDPNSEDFRRKFFNHHYYLSDQAKQEKVFANNYGDYDTSFWLFKEYFQSARAISIRDRSASTDIATQLPEEFLMMTDRFSMAHSIEARTPFLDHRLAELVLGLPSQLRTSHGDLKGLLRESITDLLPPQLLTAPKRGFVIPLNYWLRSKLRPVVEYLLEPKRLIAQGVFRPEFNRYYVKPHLTGNADYTHIVWAAMMFQLWYLIFIDGQGKRPSFKISDLLK